MKRTRSFLCVVLVLLICACGKDDVPTTPIPETVENPNPEPDSENRAPGIFELLEIADMETDVTLLPSLKWNTSTDPDGDMVSYDLLLGKDESALTAIATGLNTTLFNVDERLSLFTKYYWNVIAKDGKGKETTSEIYSFTTRNLNIPETAENPEASFSERKSHTVTFFKDRFWLLGGEEEDDTVKKDIFYSSNGIDWTKASGELPVARTSHSAVVFNDTLWVLGGRAFPAEFTRRNRLYSTNDGSNFTIGTLAPWSARERHTSVVFKERVWILGGIDNDGNALNDVWSTDNVNAWEPDSGTIASWSGRYGHSTVVFDDKLWIIGGFNGNYLNEVWFTDGTILSDGNLKWEFVPQEKGFPARKDHKTIIYDGKMWIVGGDDGVQTRNDIWYSEDGAHWLALNEDAIFNGRISPALGTFDDKLLMIGGFDGAQYRNDIWVFD